jgi:hypothetical protein
MRSIFIQYMWLDGNNIFLIPTIEIDSEIKCISLLFLKFSFDIHYEKTS